MSIVSQLHEFLSAGSLTRLLFRKKYLRRALEFGIYEGETPCLKILAKSLLSFDALYP